MITVGASEAAVCNHHAQGGLGAIDLANAVIRACQTPPQFKFLYPLDIPIKVCRSLSPEPCYPATAVSLLAIIHNVGPFWITTVF